MKLVRDLTKRVTCMRLKEFEHWRTYYLKSLLDSKVYVPFTRDMICFILRPQPSQSIRTFRATVCICFFFFLCLLIRLEKYSQVPSTPILYNLFFSLYVAKYFHKTCYSQESVCYMVVYRLLPISVSSGRWEDWWKRLHPTLWTIKALFGPSLGV